jgi:hypothetical protein
VTGGGTGSSALVTGGGTGSNALVTGGGTGSSALVTGGGTGSNALVTGGGTGATILVTGGGTGTEAITVTLPGGTGMSMEVVVGCNTASITVLDSYFVPVVQFPNVQLIGDAGFCNGNGVSANVASNT